MKSTANHETLRPTALVSAGVPANIAGGVTIRRNIVNIKMIRVTKPIIERIKLEEDKEEGEN